MELNKIEIQELIIAAWEAGFLSRNKEQEKIKKGASAIDDKSKFDYAKNVLEKLNIEPDIELNDIKTEYREINKLGMAIINGKKVKVSRYEKHDESFGNHDFDITIHDDSKQLTEEEHDELYNYLQEAEW